jgi:hypothetical protein
VCIRVFPLSSGAKGVKKKAGGVLNVGQLWLTPVILATQDAEIRKIVV